MNPPKASYDYRCTPVGRRHHCIHEPQSRLLRQCPNGELFRTSKTEVVHHRQHQTRAEPQRIFSFFDAFYNRTGSVPPSDVPIKMEKEMQLKPAQFFGIAGA
ncbi:hypothetical protein [Bradyrhizobium macuxiense]|uniref:hypothetical protein n=1 Tax=Bradyrhizobium macuxiense TaxID=1755647 RepID=UPI0024BF330F|nr:hypothetical protein [Bradyrhizobium macuxiense]